MPAIGWLATGGDASAYRYLLHGIRDFPTSEALAEEMRRVGFVNVSFERLSLGIVAIHTGDKIGAAPLKSGLHRTAASRGEADRLISRMNNQVPAGNAGPALALEP